MCSRRIRHVDQYLGNVFHQHRIVNGVEFLEICRLDVLHQQIQLPLNLAMFDIVDDAGMIANFRQDLTSREQTACGRQN